MPDVWEVKGVSVNNFKDMSRGELIALASNRGLELDDARKAQDLLMRVIGTLESDTLAASFQSMAQYRKHLLEVAKGEA